MQELDSTTDSSFGEKVFEFTGNAKEYFFIWIVNVLLTIVTLGIYSAWAKVRTQQYFYGNTKLDGVTFRYHADPLDILKGRAIAFALFWVYYTSGLFSPVIAGIILLIIMLLVPALIVMSMSFRLRNSSYRNVRFNFEKDFKRAYTIFMVPVLFIGAYIYVISLLQPEKMTPGQEPEKALIGLIMILPLIIMLMFPFWEFLITQFKVAYSKFGDASFAFHASAKDYYKMYLKAFLLPILIALIGIFAAILIPMFAGGGAEPELAAPDSSASSGAADTAATYALFSSAAFGVLFMLFYLWLFAYIQTKRTNLIFSNININGHQLNSELKVAYMMYLYFTNTLAMALTLGLMMPWAKVRTAKYKASVTSLTTMSDLSEFVNIQKQHQSAIGEEIGEMFDMDLGF